MIDHEETGYSVATGARKLAGHRTSGRLEGACAVIRVRRVNSDHATESMGETRNASMSRAYISAPYKATQILHAASHAAKLIRRGKAVVLILHDEAPLGTGLSTIVAVEIDING